MIRSMTAYARQEIKRDWGTAVWELRSVNQRYLETTVRLPEQLRFLEPVIRERLRARLTRGKVECNLQLELNPSVKTAGLVLNHEIAKQLIEAANWIKTQTNEGLINPLEVLRWPGVIAAKEQDLDEISTQVTELLELALDSLISNREREGQSLQNIIEQRLLGVQSHVNLVRTKMPEVLQWQREKLHAKLEEAEIKLDNNRLEQEIIMLAQRIDVAEELDRLEAHIKEMNAILKMDEAVGRRLDFMMQEFNRESNTLASKSINAEITNAAIELKVLIEQMREQIQNIE